jgi:outer membrane protein OmpA-like peptidoglycan-associated protein
MNIKVWHVFLAIVLCLSVVGSGVAADCGAIKKALKQERSLKKKRNMVTDAIMQCPEDPAINYKYALSLERFRKYDQALGYYQKAVLKSPKMAKAHAGMGDVYIYLGLLDDAIDSYQKAVTYMPENDRYKGRYSRLRVKRKALRGDVLSVGDVITVMDHRGKIPSNMSLLLTGPALQYHIAFVEGSDRLQPTGIRQLGAVGQAMQNDAIGHVRFEISVHVDSALSALEALEDSKVRANMIKDQLVTNFQIDPKRLDIKWYGDAQPLDTGKVAGGINANERVEIKRIIE